MKPVEPLKPIPVEGTIDVILLVWGGGGNIGLPDPDPNAMRPIIAGWTDSERAEVIRYAASIHAVAGDNLDERIPPKPTRLIELMDAVDCQFV